MTQRLLTIALLASGCAPSPSPLPESAAVIPENIADLPGYTEGIAFDAGAVAFVSAGRSPSGSHAVYRLTAGKPPERWLDLRMPNGHKVLADGSHVIAGEGTIVHVSPDARILDSLSADTNGVPFRRPNDIALDGNSGFYFTDPGTGDTTVRLGKLFYVDAGWTVTQAADGFCYPNGVVVRADGRVLYLDDSCDGRLYRLPILSPGNVGDREVIAIVSDSIDAGLDGMTLDQEGRLYIAHNGVGRVEVFDSAGRPLGHYAAGNVLASNVTFGGRDLRDLYVTGSPGDKMGPGAVFRLRLGVRGRSSMAVPTGGPASR
jgi:gluconolactonase